MAIIFTTIAQNGQIKLCNEKENKDKMMDDKIMKTILPPVILSFAVALACFDGYERRQTPTSFHFIKTGRG